MPLERPIPAFYCCYLLRSTVRHGSVYVGSTPHPVRRLKQHNGEAKGGAVRTSRQSLRPWEMTCIVTGFPSHIAALQFEWAWQNPHLTLHIPPTSRLTVSSAKKRSGHPKRPRHTIASLLSNLHLLLRVPSFSRWPLELRFFNQEVYKAWLKWCKTSKDQIRSSIEIITTFPPPDLSLESVEDNEGPSPKRRKVKASHGIDALTVDHSNEKPHVEKAKILIDFEREGSCSLCHEDLEHDAGLYAVCPTPGCEAVTHLTCLGRYFLENEGGEALVPIEGRCPGCKKEMRWTDVVRELTLRIRGQKEVEKLLKVRRTRKGKVNDVSASQATQIEMDEDDDADEEMEMEDELEMLQDDQGDTGKGVMGDTWHEIDDSDDSDGESVVSTASRSKASVGPSHGGNLGRLGTVIEDSDFDEAEVLD